MMVVSDDPEVTAQRLVVASAQRMRFEQECAALKSSNERLIQALEAKARQVNQLWNDLDNMQNDFEAQIQGYEIALAEIERAARRAGYAEILDIVEGVGR